eukprot:gnl/TRDRNA2_/TRDRNA2_170799_c2_seq1.p1 gnl/TRDRNA2_/TRDRNA2_170799_c2~~gnl/TRDRNA2_/TRDRNA2_170799_c2_seq1.p1  ORF type:complete len:107 (+),score=16.81 gnl/TRDRNA2_/TRDRNA2_170799_c2_seq1:201-521(+)
MLTLLYWSSGIRLGIVRCDRNHAEKLGAALALTSSIRGCPAQFRVHRVGGTLRAVQDTGAEIIRRSRERALQQVGNAAREEVRAVREGFALEARQLAAVGEGRELN